MSNLFDVDIRGFKQTIQGEAARILLEPISNALDTEARKITVDLSWSNGNAVYTVEDDDADGFASLKEAWTLFAPSRRKADATKRGRFGFGEKEFIALCYPGEVTIASTTGAVSFKGDERVQTKARRTAGSIIQAKFRLTRAETEEFIARVRTLIVPPSVEFHFFHRIGDDVQMWIAPTRLRVAQVSASLPTVTVDEEGNLRPAKRTTTVDVIEPETGERPTIYELGVPVVEIDGRYSVNIGQKVPLNRSRDNVTPAYLRAIHELVLNETYDLLTPVEAKQAWVTEALPTATPEALARVVSEIHGSDAVIYDPSNPEASKLAVEEGRTVVYGRQFPAEVWKAIREHEILKPAGQVIQTGVPTSADGHEPIPVSEWTPRMEALAEYARDLGTFLLGSTPAIEFQSISRSEGRTGDFAAWWGGGRLTFNLGCLGRSWPERASGEEVDALLIHEFAHNAASDHYSSAFYSECCRLGARLRRSERTWS